MRILLIIMIIASALFSQQFAAGNEDWGEEEYRGRYFYDSMAVKFDKNRFTRLLYDAVIVPNDPVLEDTASAAKGVKGEEIFEPFSGMVIDSIIIIDLKPRLTREKIKEAQIEEENASDTTNLKQRLKRVEDSMTFGTYDYVIRNIIGISAGDTINPYEIAESERYLRSQAYIEDVRIVPVQRENGKIILEVLKKEAFPYAFSFSIKDYNAFTAGLKNMNFARIGGDFQNYLIADGDYEPRFGYRGSLGFTNIGRSYHFVRVFGEMTPERDQIGLSVGRNFAVRSIRNAWGVDLIGQDDLITLDDTVDFRLKHHVEDLWYGHAFHSKVNETQSIYLTSRFQRKRYIHRPEVGFDSNVVYHNEDLLLGSFVFRDLRYYRSRMIYSFGVTEDVPYGIIFQLTGGYKFSEFLERPYFDVRFGVANYVANVGYFSGSMQMSSYVRNSAPEDVSAQFRMFYYSPLISIRRSRLRVLCNAEYVQRAHTLRFDEFNLNGRIRYYGDGDAGFVRTSLRVEPILYLPWNLIGFRFAPFTFTDVAILADTPTLITGDEVYWGFGGGLRVRNESLVFNTVEIAGGYYPPAGGKDADFKFSFSTSTKTLFRGFGVGRPGTFTAE